MIVVESQEGRYPWRVRDTASGEVIEQTYSLDAACCIADFTHQFDEVLTAAASRWVGSSGRNLR